MAAGYQFGDYLINFSMDSVGKMLRFEKLRNFFKSFVIGKNCPEESLFGLEILGKNARIRLFHIVVKSFLR